MKSFLPLLLAPVLPLLAGSCTPFRGGGWEAGWTERAAQDRIMLVRNSPETLGHRRLVFQSATHPDLKVFLSQKGLPDFIAETSSDDRQYLVLYYLDKRKGYICRTHRVENSEVVFAGPYNMTKRETGVLRELQHNSSQVPVTLKH
ncbi:hypothetical protein [Haloferula sp. BvORR071]|uniref:hypothetical protein n=1 Tax=Haloferula sp. BvORR071 TaxID=1396141 RepID=UPI0005500E2E|nr:hypothetical protein [Haloferula sp. BvORR071]